MNSSSPFKCCTQSLVIFFLKHKRKPLVFQVNSSCQIYEKTWGRISQMRTIQTLKYAELEKPLTTTWFTPITLQMRQKENTIYMDEGSTYTNVSLEVASDTDKKHKPHDCFITLARATTFLWVHIFFLQCIFKCLVVINLQIK